MLDEADYTLSSSSATAHELMTKREQIIMRLLGLHGGPVRKSKVHALVTVTATGLPLVETFENTLDRKPRVVHSDPGKLEAMGYVGLQKIRAVLLKDKSITQRKQDYGLDSPSYRQFVLSWFDWANGKKGKKLEGNGQKRRRRGNKKKRFAFFLDIATPGVYKSQG